MPRTVNIVSFSREYSRVHTLLVSASLLALGMTFISTAKADTTHKAKHVRHDRSYKTQQGLAPQSLQPDSSPAALLPSNIAPETSLSQINSDQSEQLIVTGSALTTANNTSPNPVQIVTARQIQNTGATTLSEFFQRLPSVGSSGQYNTQTNSTNGASCLDLRNLGQERVLVLVDGKRTTLNGDTNCVDLNTIPVQQVASVEILKDGGSELYGADAVGGVVNIKLRHNINDANITLRGTITGYGDNRVGLLSAYKGWNFDHDKGNVTLFGSYMTTGGILQRNRDWSRNPQINNPSQLGKAKYGSAITPSGFVLGNTSGDRYSIANGQTTDYTGERYNFADDTSLTNALQVASLSGDAHYDFNNHFSLYSNVLYSHKTSSAFSAPIPIASFPNDIYIPKNYPGNLTEEDAVYYRRAPELGRRRTESAMDNVTSKIGLQGEITRRWMYDLSYTYGVSQNMVQKSGMGNYLNTMREFGLVPSNLSNLTDPNMTYTYDPNSCAGYAGCVQSSALRPLSKEAADYANYISHSHVQYQLRDLNFRLHNNHVVRMPWNHGGDLGLALGMEHRGEQLSYNPDPLLQSGNTLAGKSSPTGGQFNVSEGYAEGRLALLHNAPLAHDLSVDVQGRYSAYNTFGNTKNWKAGVDWAPTRDVRFRGTLGTSFRQPNVTEAYAGEDVGFNGATDPCAQASSYGALSNAVIANCAAHGINTGTFEQAGNAQIPTIGGGNAKLKPETGRTYTFGAVMTPRWIPGLATSVEYWHYTINGLISTLDTQYVIDSCYNNTNVSQCANINRGQTGQITSVTALSQNSGTKIESGIDWDTNYRFRITNRDSIIIDNNFQRLLSYKQQNTPDGQYYDYLGSLVYQSSWAAPVTRDYATITWRHGNFSANYMMQYTSGMRWNDGSNDLEPNGHARIKTPSMVQSDISLDYSWNKWAFTAGIQNINNKRPPFVASTNKNTSVSQYSSFMFGRTFFLQAGVNF